MLIKGANADLINGGAIRGSNLFQSFSQFNINNGQRVYFGNPTGIENILTRVTGGNASNILGTLGVNGAANLFLINPNGILFGPNASLDIRGSFVGTTANAVQFGNLGNFSATNPQAPPALLTIHPSALAFNQLNQGAGITIQSYLPTGVQIAGEEVTGLRVPDGKSLLLVGGNVNLDGGGLTASGGRVELASLAAPGSVGLNIAGDTLSLSVPSDVQRGNISLTNGAVVNVTVAGGGDIAVNAGNLQMSNSFLLAGIGKGLGDGSTKAGDININADAISLTNGAEIKNLTNGQGDAGNIIVNVRDGLNISGIGSRIFSETGVNAVGRAGNINIQAGKVVVENVGSDEGIASSIYGKGEAGDITINTRNLIVRNSQLGATVYGEGNAGNVQVIASDSVELSGEIPGNEQGFPGGIFAQIDMTGKGKGGNIYIETGRLSVSDGSKVQVATFGEGNAGSLLIRADEINVFNTGKPYYDTGIFATVGLDPRTVKPPKGNAGDLTIETGKLSLRNGGKVAVYTQGEGNGGRLFIKASDSIEVTGNSPYTSEISSGVTDSGIGNGGSITIETPQLSVTNGGQITSSTSGKGNAGTIDIQAGNLFVKDGGQIISSTFGKGDAGNISITARDAISLDGTSYIANSVQSVDAVGNGGKIDITTGSLTATNGAQINSFTRGQGNAGNITIQARDAVTFDGEDSNANPSASYSSVVAGGVGNGGNINITAGSLSLTNGGALNTDVSGQSGTVAGGQGIGGNVNINVRDALTISGANSRIVGSLYAGAIGRGGDIKVEAGNLFVRDGGQIISSTFGKGDAGNISITARDAISLDGTSYIANNVQSVDAVGNGGKIDITTGSLSATNGAEINSFTRGQGSAGNITIQAKDGVTFDGQDSYGNLSGSFTSVVTGAVGNGGNINITAGSLSLTNGGRLNSYVSGQSGTVAGGQGIGGNVNINVRDALTIAGANSGILGYLGTGAIGRGGDVKVEAGNLFVRDGGVIISSTLGKGNAGNISITANNAISLDHAFLVNNVQSNDAVGNGGNIDIKTGSLTATNGAQINSFTRGQGNAGNITIQARDAVTFDGTFSDGFFIYPSAAFSSVSAGAVGKGGNINITAGSASLTNGARLSASTDGQGNAGNIRINAKDAVTVSGTSQERGLSTGLFVSSTSSGITGDIEINSPKVTLDNQGKLNAESASGNGGNININSDILLLRHGAQISATAGTDQAGGNGGNITINTPFIIAVPGENSDITANAYTGAGGNVNITAESILGIEASSQPSDTTNDITASSQLGVQGEVSINQPQVQPTAGLLKLPEKRIDASNQLGQLCPRGRYAKKPLGEFVVTGHGSLPPNLLQPMTGTANMIPLATLDEETATRTDGLITPVINHGSSPIIEAQGFARTPEGKIIIVADASQATPSSRPTAPVCPESK